MNDIKIFENEQFGKIRTAGTADKPLFCLTDICKIFSLQVTPTKNRLKPDGVSLIKGVSKTTNQYGVTTEQEVEMLFINEQNLYRLIMRSDKPIAEPFQDWVCGDVLPTIRKTGAYGIPKTYAEALRLAADQQEKIEQQQKTIEAHETEILALNDKVGKMQPKAKYYDLILRSKNTVLATQIAKDYGFSAYKFNKLLERLHIQYKLRGQWVLYAEYAGEGCTKSVSVSFDYNDGTCGTKLRTEWTQKGRLFLYDKLKANGVLPTIDDGSADVITFTL